MKEYHKINSLFKRDEKGKLMFGIYSCPEFEYLAYTKWVWTEKIDGTNIRVIYDDNKVIIRGRTDNAQIYTKLIEKLNNIFTADRFKTIINCPVCCLYGEGFGAKIQKGGGNYIKDDVGFILFDVMIDGLWLERHNIVDIAEKFNIPVVPIIGEGTLYQFCDKVQEGFNSTFGNFKAEGLVAKPIIELFNRRRERIIVKLKYRDFKDEYEKTIK